MQKPKTSSKPNLPPLYFHKVKSEAGVANNMPLKLLGVIIGGINTKFFATFAFAHFHCSPLRINIAQNRE